MDQESKLKSYIKLLREKYKINIFPGDVPLLCNECDLENMKFADLNDFGYVHLKLSYFGIDEPFHRASIIGYNSNVGPKWFLIDPTYGQFFKNKKFMNYMFFNHPQFSTKLLENGYIECNLDNMLCYIEGFTNSGAFVKYLDSKVICENVYNFLTDNNIINNSNKKR